MNIYLLTREYTYYDEAAAFVIIAKDAKTARELAAERPGDEGATTWRKPTLSKVRKIGVAPGHWQGIVLRDFNAG